MTKHRPGARPRRAGSGPAGNPPRRGAGQSKPNTGAKTGGTGRGTQHKPAVAGNSSCKKNIVPALLLMPYALVRLALDTWRGR